MKPWTLRADRWDGARDGTNSSQGSMCQCPTYLEKQMTLLIVSVDGHILHHKR